MQKCVLQPFVCNVSSQIENLGDNGPHIGPQLPAETSLPVPA